MASVVRIKRSAVAGKRPTISNIETGELALNLSDGRLYSSDGSVVFEIGANTHSLYVGSGGATFANGAFTLPSSDGSSGQFLTTDGNGNVSWGTVSADTVGGTVPFYNSSGNIDTITVTSGEFPFYNSSGTSDPIPVS